MSWWESINIFSEYKEARKVNERERKFRNLAIFLDREGWEWWLTSDQKYVSIKLKDE